MPVTAKNAPVVLALESAQETLSGIAQTRNQTEAERVSLRQSLARLQAQLALASGESPSAESKATVVRTQEQIENLKSQISLCEQTLTLLTQQAAASHAQRVRAQQIINLRAERERLEERRKDPRTASADEGFRRFDHKSVVF